MSSSSYCTFKDIERISICDGGASDHVASEIAFHQDDSDISGAPNAISWHEAACGVEMVALYVENHREIKRFAQLAAQA